MVAVTVTDTDELEGVVARLQRVLEELSYGVDDVGALVADLSAAGEDLDDFTGRLRQVLGV